MTLFKESLGNGKESITFLHGWGLNGSIFEPLAEQFTDQWQVDLIDLPGHGKSPLIEGDYTLKNIAQAVADALTEKTTLLGWSLGGMVAQQVAIDFPDKVKQLILIASTPQFIKSKEWPCATSEAVLDSFSTALENDYKSTLQTFLALQAKGSESAREDIRLMRKKLFSHGEPQTTALQGGLEILKSSRLRGQLNKITMPVQIIMGQHDTLMPHPAGPEFNKLLSDSQCHIIKHAGHAPFISHLEETTNIIKQFIHKQDA